MQPPPRRLGVELATVSREWGWGSRAPSWDGKRVRGACWVRVRLDTLVYLPIACIARHRTPNTSHMQNRQPHLHCTRCFKWDKCKDPNCRQLRMHPGQFCSHGFQLLHQGPDCPVHCAWECIAKMLKELGWDKRDAECMSNIVLNQEIGLAQHADMPPRNPLETPELVLSRVKDSAACSKALAAAKAFMAAKRSAPHTQTTEAAAAQPPPSMPAAAGGPPVPTPCRNWAATGSCRWGDTCRYAYSHQ